MSNRKPLTVVLAAGAIALLNLTTAQAQTSATARDTTPTGVPLNIAKRLDHVPEPSTVFKSEEISGRSMRQAKQMDERNPTTQGISTTGSMYELSGIPMVRAKRL